MTVKIDLKWIDCRFICREGDDLFEFDIHTGAPTKTIIGYAVVPIEQFDSAYVPSEFGKEVRESWKTEPDQTEQK